MIFDHDELATAVVFFGNDGLVAREMHYSEFEAILDNYVPTPEWSGKQARVVYLSIDNQLRIRSLVFFLIGFTRQGLIDPNWNLPLDKIAGSAMRGPDLGAGPIRLACASQCPIQYFKSMLWDPNLRAGSNQLGLLKKLVARNRLGIQFKDAPESELNAVKAAASAERMEKQISTELRSEYAKEFRDQMAQMLKDQRLRTATVANDGKRAISTLKLEHNHRIEEYRVIIEEKNRALADERERNQQLKDTIDGQAKKIEGLREYFEHKIEQAEGVGIENISALKDNFQLESEAKIEAATTELKDMLQMREMELLYRNEQESQLRDEITRLRKENQQLLSNSGEQLLNRLTEKGVSFVTYQPGAGHITIPLADTYSYMENPLAYSAAQCGVTESHYKAWLEHYQTPVCHHTDEQGSLCGENLPRIENPTDFHAGDEDRCESHKEIGGAQSLKLVSG